MKYISFSPYFSGLSNVIMSYEVALAISYITKRTLILPPDAFLLFISPSEDKKDFVDIWEVFDKKYIKETFDCIDFYDVLEFQGKFKDMETDRSYTGNIHKVIPNLVSINLKDKVSVEPHTLIDGKYIITNKTYLNQDYERFSSDRNPLNLSSFNYKFIHFENNLFGHYWYSVYPGDESERNKMKRLINTAFRYKQKYYDLSNKVTDKLKNYNAVHIRRNDFLQTRTNELEIVSNGEKILEKLKLFFDTSTPLYIATDEKDKSFFDIIKNEYDIYFYEDFGFELNELEHTIIEQIICANAEVFYGTALSTYSSRINVMRGIEGKQSDDDIGINQQVDDCYRDLTTANPWRKRTDKRWHWNDSSHPQWKKEKNGIYINA